MTNTNEEHIQNIIEQMTLPEKASLLAAADMWHTTALPRLELPAIQVTDGPNGVRGEDDNIGQTSVCFPVGSALAATWNPTLVQRVGAALADQVKAKGAHVLLAPTVNIHRTPNAGRNFECYSEDPYLGGKMASAYIQGLQQNDVAACIKHFVCNDQEFERFSISAEIDNRPLHEIYLEPFRLAVQQANPWSIMSAYNRINSTHASEHKKLLGEILKEKWGYDGLVMSDWYGTYSDGVPAGDLDLEMPGPARWMEVEKVVAAVEGGQIDEAHIDQKVRRLLRLITRVGAFSPGRQADLPQPDSPQERAVARQVAVEAIVLLKNEDDLLPIDLDQVQRIAVIGESARWAKIMGGGSAEVNPHYAITPLQGITDFVGNRAQISYQIGAPFYKKSPLLEMDWAESESGHDGALTLRYFDNLNLQGRPSHTAEVFKPNLSWFGTVNPYVDPSNFSLRLSGRLNPPQTRSYQFSLTSIGRSRLYLDDQLLIDQWHDDWNKEERQQIAQIDLQEGRPAGLRLEFSPVPDTNWPHVSLGMLPYIPDDPIQAAADLAAQSDIAVIVAGLSKEWESEGFDRPDLKMPGQQDQLIRRVAQANPRTIVLLNAGSPLEMPWIDQVPAVLQTWYLGQETGNALAIILFGAQNPSGKLPTTFPKRYEDNPAFNHYPGQDGRVHYEEGIFVGYRHYDQNEIDPLFPFGHGLSYSTFRYDNPRLNSDSFQGQQTIELSFEVTNESDRLGQEVVQLYIHDQQASLPRPPQELKAFRKVKLQPGESKTITFQINKEQLSFYNPDLKDWTAEQGTFDLLIGRSSRDIRLRKSFEWRP